MRESEIEAYLAKVRAEAEALGRDDRPTRPVTLRRIVVIPARDAPELPPRITSKQRPGPKRKQAG